MNRILLIAIVTLNQISYSGSAYATDRVIDLGTLKPGGSAQGFGELRGSESASKKSGYSERSLGNQPKAPSQTRAAASISSGLPGAQNLNNAFANLATPARHCNTQIKYYKALLKLNQYTLRFAQSLPNLRKAETCSQTTKALWKDFFAIDQQLDSEAVLAFAGTTYEDRRCNPETTPLLKYYALNRETVGAWREAYEAKPCPFSAPAQEAPGATSPALTISH